MARPRATTTRCAAGATRLLVVEVFGRDVAAECRTSTLSCVHITVAWSAATLCDVGFVFQHLARMVSAGS